MAAVEAQLGAATAAVLAVIDKRQLQWGAIVQPVTTATGERVTVAVMSLDGATANGGKLDIPISSAGEGFQTKVEIPASALASALRAASASGGHMAMSVSITSASTLEALAQAAEGGSPKLVGASLTVSMFDQNSNPLVIRNLEEPIIFKVSSNASADTRCMFWNASLAAWSEKGVTRLIGSNSDLTCSTTHLSIFAGIIEKVGQTFLCSSAAPLFSHEAMSSISTGEWASTGPSICMWLTIFAFVAFSVCAAVLDHRDSKKYEATVWRMTTRSASIYSVRSSRSYATSNGAAEPEEATNGRFLHWCQFVGVILLEIGTMLLETSVGRFKAVFQAVLYNASEAPESVVDTAVKQALSFQLGISSQSLTIIQKLNDDRELKDLSCEANAMLKNYGVYQLSRKVAAETDFAIGAEHALSSFLGRSSFYRFVCLCAALNPVLAMTSLSLFDTHLARACLFCVRIVGAAAANAVFYDMSALPKNMTQDLQARCAVEDSYGWVGNLAVGITSALLSDGAMYLLGGIRGLQHPELALLDGAEIPPDMMEYRSIAAQVTGWIFWVASLSYSGLCLYIVLAFNSSVSLKDQEEWLLACLWTLLELLILECIVGAFVMTILCGFIFCCSSTIKTKVQQRRSFAGRFSMMSGQDRQGMAGQRSMVGVVIAASLPSPAAPPTDPALLFAQRSVRARQRSSLASSADLDVIQIESIT